MIMRMNAKPQTGCISENTITCLVSSVVLHATMMIDVIKGVAVQLCYELASPSVLLGPGTLYVTLTVAMTIQALSYSGTDCISVCFIVYVVVQQRRTTGYLEHAHYLPLH